MALGASSSACKGADDGADDGANEDDEGARGVRCVACAAGGDGPNGAATAGEKLAASEEGAAAAAGAGVEGARLVVAWSFMQFLPLVRALILHSLCIMSPSVVLCLVCRCSWALHALVWVLYARVPCSHPAWRRGRGRLGLLCVRCRAAPVPGCNLARGAGRAGGYSGCGRGRRWAGRDA